MILSIITIIFYLALVLGFPLAVGLYIVTNKKRGQFDHMVGWFVLKSVSGIVIILLFVSLIPHGARSETFWHFAGLISEIIFVIAFIVAFQQFFKSILGSTLLVLDIFRLLVIYTFFPIGDFIDLMGLFAVFSSTIYAIFGIAILQIKKNFALKGNGKQQ